MAREKYRKVEYCSDINSDNSRKKSKVTKKTCGSSFKENDFSSSNNSCDNDSSPNVPSPPHSTNGLYS